MTCGVRKWLPEKGQDPPAAFFETPGARLFRRKRVRDRGVSWEIPKVPHPTVIRPILRFPRVTPRDRHHQRCRSQRRRQRLALDGATSRWNSAREFARDITGGRETIMR